MFDTLLAAIRSAKTPGERVRAEAMLENAACAARLNSMYDLLQRAHAASGSADRDGWRCDNWAAVCAQIGAAQTLTSGMVNHLLTNAVTLRERFPKVAALFAEGVITYLLVRTICKKTALVKDPDARRALDEALAAELREWGAKSVDQTDADLDALIARHDPYAVRRTQEAARIQHASVYIKGDTAEVDATVTATDGAAFDQRLDRLARTVCFRDPRTRDQLRGAALGAMGFGWDRLPCLCEHPDCDAATTPPVGGVVIHVIAGADALGSAAGPGGRCGTQPEPPPPPTEPEPEPEDDFEPPPDDDWDDDGCDDDAAERGEWDHVDETGDGSDPEAESEAEVSISEDRADGESDCTAEVSDPDRGTEVSEFEAEHEQGLAPEVASEPQPPPEPQLPADGIGDLTAQRRGLVGESPRGVRLADHHTWESYFAALHAERYEFSAARPGVVLGGGVLPGPVIAQLAMYATITPLTHPGDAAPEPRYRPSQKLADFIRARDLTCRFPGCTRPATRCQLDHIIPYPYGPTAASNLACLCIEHHLLKTFWPGWTYTLDPDGTAHWTDPDGHTSTSYPGCRLLFPELSEPTAPVTARGTPPPKHTAGLTMPRRTITRKQAREKRIDDERRANTEWAEQYLRDSVPPF